MINKKILSPLMLAASVLLASCSQDEVMTDTGPDGLVPVTLSAAVGDDVQTRTIDADDDEDAKYCYVQVCDEQGNAYTDNDYATPTRLTDEDKDGTFTGNIYLKPNVSHVFLFWADNATSDILADLHSVTYQKGSIAFADRVEQTIGSVAPTIKATLQHVVAKVTLKTTTNVDASDVITVTIPTKYQAYNVNTEAPITTADNTPFVHTVTSDITGTTDGTEVFSFYALVDEANQNLTLTNGTNSQPVSNVPLGPNKHTTLVGDVRNLGLTNATFTASVETTWGSTPIIGEGYEIDREGNYTVTTAEGLKAWTTAVQSNSSLNCTLADDITLPEVTDGGSNWTPISDFAGTFDGNYKTITGLTINKLTGSNVGLFASIAKGGTVKNLKLDDVDITAGSNVGAIAGENRGTIENCSVSGSVTSSAGVNNSNVGSIVGLNRGTITGCTTKGSVKAESGIWVGGLL